MQTNKLKLKKQEASVDAQERIKELEHLVEIAQKHAAHADTESAQSRASRDSWKDKYLVLVKVLRENGIPIPNEKTAINALKRIVPGGIINDY